MNNEHQFIQKFPQINYPLDIDSISLIEAGVENINFLNEHQFIQKFLQINYPLDIDSISLIKAGVENINFLVETPTVKYVFRVYNLNHSIRGSRNKEQVELELSFSHQASLANIKTPSLILNKEKSNISLIELEGKQHFSVLLEFIEGKSPSEYNDSISSQVGVVVNKIFIVGSSFKNQTVFKESNDIVSRGFSKYKEVSSLADKNLNNWNKTSELNNKLQKKFKTIESIPLSMGLVHGDIKLENMLFKDGSLSAVLDFDDFRFSYLLEEAVMALMHNFHSKTENIIRSGNYQVFIDQLKDPVLSSELKYLKFFLQIRFLYDICKYQSKGNVDLVNTLWQDTLVQKYILD